MIQTFLSSPSSSLQSPSLTCSLPITQSYSADKSHTYSAPRSQTTSKYTTNETYYDTSDTLAPATSNCAPQSSTYKSGTAPCPQTLSASFSPTTPPHPPPTHPACSTESQSATATYSTYPPKPPNSSYTPPPHFLKGTPGVTSA